MKELSLPVVALLIFYCTFFLFSVTTEPILKKDKYGRKYKIKGDGSIQILLEGEYQKIFPYSDQLEVHKSEAMLLSELRKDTDSIRLLKSVLYCESLEKTTNHFFSSDQTIPAKLNSLLNRYKDSLQEVHLLTEPYGCYTTQGTGVVLKIQSRSIPFSLTLPERYQFDFSTEKVEAYPNQPFVWKKFSLFKEPEDHKLSEVSFESEIELLENGSKEVSQKITIRGILAIFKPGFTMNLRLFKEFVDRKRGVSKQFRTGYLQPISVSENFGTYRFFVSSESGNLVTKNYREYFSYKKNIGLAFFIYSLETDENEVEKIWTQIKNIE
jgi:hypothetical protein